MHLKYNYVNMAKIVFVSKLYSPHVGGVEKHIEKLSNELIREGHSITILTENYSSDLKVEETNKKVKIVRFEYKKTKFLGLFYLWKEFIKRISIFLSADLIHVHDVFIWILPLRFILFWKKFYLTNHGWEGIYPIPRKNILLKRLSTLLCKGSISVGSYIDEFYGIHSNKVIYGATDIPINKNFKKENRIVYVGRLSADTGLPIFLEAFKQLIDYKVDFCGDGDLNNECKKYGKVHGFVNPSNYLKNAKICFCSGYLSIIEAISYKCLVITAYDNPLKKSYFMNTPFSKWIIIVSNPDDIVDKIKKPFEYSPNIELAYNWVKPQTWRNVAMQYKDLWFS